MSLAGCYNAAVKVCHLIGSGTPGGPGIGSIIMPLLSSNFNDAVDGPQAQQSQLALGEPAPTTVTPSGPGSTFG